jgi:hypothetical protein
MTYHKSSVWPGHYIIRVATGPDRSLAVREIFLSEATHIRTPRETRQPHRGPVVRRSESGPVASFSGLLDRTLEP